MSKLGLLLPSMIDVINHSIHSTTNINKEASILSLTANGIQLKMEKDTVTNDPIKLIFDDTSGKFNFSSIVKSESQSDEPSKLKLEDQVHVSHDGIMMSTTEALLLDSIGPPPGLPPPPNDMIDAFHKDLIKEFHDYKIELVGLNGNDGILVERYGLDLSVKPKCFTHAKVRAGGGEKEKERGKAKGKMKLKINDVTVSDNKHNDKERSSTDSTTDSNSTISGTPYMCEKTIKETIDFRFTQVENDISLVFDILREKVNTRLVFELVSESEDLNAEDSALNRLLQEVRKVFTKHYLERSKQTVPFLPHLATIPNPPKGLAGLSTKTFDEKMAQVKETFWRHSIEIEMPSTSKCLECHDDLNTNSTVLTDCQCDTMWFSLSLIWNEEDMISRGFKLISERRALERVVEKRESSNKGRDLVKGKGKGDHANSVGNEE